MRLNRRFASLRNLVVVAAAVVACNCAASKKSSSEPAAGAAATTGDDASALNRDNAGINASSNVSGKGAFGPIYFEFDSESLSNDATSTLNQVADFLRTNNGAKVTIEGHCDERGSSEYNMGLGDRRARAASDYLRHQGIDASRLNTISYGKERPAVPGNDADAQAKNRRGEFSVN